MDDNRDEDFNAPNDKKISHVSKKGPGGSILSAGMAKEQAGMAIHQVNEEEEKARLASLSMIHRVNIIIIRKDSWLMKDLINNHCPRL